MSESNGQRDENRQERASSAEKPQRKVEATEAAERKARELGIDLEEVRGTGAGGRILVEDVQKVQDRRETSQISDAELSPSTRPPGALRRGSPLARPAEGPRASHPGHRVEDLPDSLPGRRGEDRQDSRRSRRYPRGTRARRGRRDRKARRDKRGHRGRRARKGPRDPQARRDSRGRPGLRDHRGR